MQTYNELLLHPAKGVEDYCRNSGASPPDRSFACMTEVEWRRGDGEWYSVCEEGVKKQFTPRHYRIRLNCPANPSHDNKSLLSEELRLLR
ncbi:MAG: hypothetical protein H6618_05575 [Deltaproteobacteria bacterium]|nr:hypothetical protein [Deltaproteobacteria bacterium]